MAWPMTSRMSITPEPTPKSSNQAALNGLMVKIDDFQLRIMEIADCQLYVNSDCMSLEFC